MPKWYEWTNLGFNRRKLITKEIPKEFKNTGVTGIESSLDRIARQERVDDYILYPLKPAKLLIGNPMRYRLYVPKNHTSTLWSTK